MKKSYLTSTEGTWVKWWWTEVPFSHESERWTGELGVTFEAAAVVHDQSWLVVVVEVIELFNNLLHFGVNAFVVVSSKVEYDLAAWVFTENAAEELVKTDQMAMGTLQSRNIE